jgi:hypothetical protein
MRKSKSVKEKKCDRCGRMVSVKLLTKSYFIDGNEYVCDKCHQSGRMNEDEKKGLTDIGIKSDVYDQLINKASKEPEFDLGFGPHALQGSDYREMKEEFLKRSKDLRDNEKLIQRYCYGIRGTTPVYDLSFEEYMKYAREDDAAFKNRLQQEFEEGTKLDKKSRAIQKQRRKLEKEQKQQEEANNKLIHDSSPYYRLLEDVKLIDCHCTADRIRNEGKFCITCMLLDRVHEYMMDAFKRLSERDTGLK